MNGRKMVAAAAMVVCVLAIGAPSWGQNPVQWQGNPRAAVEHAREQMLPLMVWVWDSGNDGLGDDDEMRDAQEAAFRDPTVVSIAHSRFVPLRLMRNSRTKEALGELGLPTEYGLYIAIVTADRRLLDKIGVEEVASPERLASRLMDASTKYVNDLYEQKLKPVISDPAASKPEVRKAVQTVWRLKILGADEDVVALLKREGLTPSERRRLYTLLASMGTPACVGALLEASRADADAATALGKAHARSLGSLLKELPGCEGGEPSERQLTAYRALVNIAGAGQVRPAKFWTDSPSEKCRAELERLRERAESVMAYSGAREGNAE